MAMRLTRHSDYALRVLIYLGVTGKHLVTIGEIAERYDVSRNHLMKVVNRLASHGYVETIRGKRGGIRLARPPEEMRVGDVVRCTEEEFNIAECFDAVQGQCRISQSCSLRPILTEALDAFMAVLDRYTVRDLLHNRCELVVALDLA